MHRGDRRTGGGDTVTVDTRHFAFVQTHRWCNSRSDPRGKRGHWEVTRHRRLIRCLGAVPAGEAMLCGAGRVAVSGAPSRCRCELNTALENRSHPRTVSAPSDPPARRRVALRPAGRRSHTRPLGLDTLFPRIKSHRLNDYSAAEIG